MITRLLIRAAVIALAVSATHIAAQAQYAMSLRFDTVTANPGNTVNLNVYYKFTSEPPQNVQDFNARFDFDTSEIHLIGYILEGTASASFFDTTGSHDGLLAIGTNGASLDLSNPVLFTIRFQVDKRLADTAFIRWDTNWSVFDFTDSIDVSQQNGWIRTASAGGNVVLSTPSMTVDTGEVFRIPVSISGIENANADSALLRFEMDSTRLLFNGVIAGLTSNAVVQWVSVTQSVDTSHLDTVSVLLKAASGNFVSSDSLIEISFYSIPWYDTACVAIRDTRFEALNSGSLIGNTVSDNGSICIVPGSKPPESVNADEVRPHRLAAYPNPARDQVTFDAGINPGRVTIEVYDALGRRVFMSNGSSAVWQIPDGIQPGAYIARMDSETGSFTTCFVIEP